VHDALTPEDRMRPHRLAALAAPLVAAALACGGGSSGGVPLDPNKPDDALLLSGIGHYDQANQLATTARAEPVGTQRDADVASAVDHYRQAIAAFHALPVDFPDSIRRDNAAYLEGRCHYEIGTLTAGAGELAIARDLLDAAQAAYPTSSLLDSMSYFDGRSRFELAALHAVPDAVTAEVQAEYAGAWAQFDRSAKLNAGAPWGDNSAYYRGRSDFELGYLGAHPLETGASPPSPGTQVFTDLTATFTRAEAELAAVPSASSWKDNARYYLGRAWFELPSDTTLADWRTRRVTALGNAAAAFGPLVGSTSVYAGSARYWRGRAYYARETYGATADAKNADLALAAADFRAVPAGHHYQDNACYDLAKALVSFRVTGTEPNAPYCQDARPGDAAPASACASLAALRTLVASDAAFSASPYPDLTVSYLAAASPSCTCP
jgi:tetratricopeptide (TPR) repeat protein